MIVVPMLAPRTTPIACFSCMMPLLTNPTAMTVVIELDCTRHVTRVPTPTASSRLSVTMAMSLRSDGPAIVCRPSDMYLMPSRKIPRPPQTVKTSSSPWNP